MPTIDSRQLRRYIVRIDRADRTAADGTVALGTGFFVAPGWVLTAAHVVYDPAAAVELDRVAMRPADSVVGETPVTAEVAARSSPPTTAGGLWPFPDMAVLRLDGALDHPCVLLEGVDPAGDADCHAWGYAQRDYEADPVGEPAMFGFEGVDRDGFLQLRQGLAAPGLSGAPLVCPTRGAVVGVITASRHVNLDLGGWAAPVAALLAGGPGVPDNLAAVGKQIAWLNSVARLEGQASWDRVLRVAGNNAIPREVILHRAHRLGGRFALLTLMEAGPPSLGAGPPVAERDREIQFYKSACKDLCGYLSIPFPPFESPTNAERTEKIVSRIQQSHQLAAQISQRFGTDVAATFQFSFDVGLSPEMIPFLPPKHRTDSIRSIAGFATQAGLPTEIVDKVTAFLDTATDRSAMLAGVFDHHEAVSHWWFERQDQKDAWTRDAHSTIWRFAKNAALAAISLPHGDQPRSVNSFARALRFGDELDVVPSPLFDLTGVDVTDHAAALHYLLVKLPKPLTSRFSDRYGPGSLHVLKLCTRLWTLPVIYHPEDDLGLLVASVVETECEALKIPRYLYEELISAIHSGSDFKTVKNLVFRFDHAVTNFLSRPQPSQRCRVCTWRCTVCGAARAPEDG